MEWFKFFGAEYLGDPKTRNFSAMYHSCWLHLLCFAANSSTPGVIEYLDEEDLMLYSGISPMHEEWEQTKGVLKAFEERNMIKIDGHKISVRNWAKRQESYVTNAERQKQYRERKRTESLQPLQRPLQQSNARIEENRIDTTGAAAPDMEITEEKLDKEGNSIPRRKVSGEKTKQYEELLRWAESRRGFPFVNRVKQYTFFKKAKQGNISIARVKQRWIEIEGQNRQNGFDWADVVSSFDKKS